MGLATNIFNDFSGGRDNSEEVLVARVASPVSPDLQDVTLPASGKSLDKRLGTLRDTSWNVAAPSVIENMMPWYPPAGSPFVAASIDGDIRAILPGGGGSTNLLLAGSAPWHFSPMMGPSNNAFIAAMNGVDTPRAITSAVSMVSWGGSVPQGKCSAVWHNFAVVAGDPAFPQRLYFSTLGDTTTFTVATDFIDVRSSEGDKDLIVELAIIGDQLVIIKRNSIWRLTAGPPKPEVIRVAEIGCPDRFMYAVLENRMYFWGGRPWGLYSYDIRTDTLVVPVKYETAHIETYIKERSDLTLVPTLTRVSRVGRRIYVNVPKVAGGYYMLEFIPDMRYKPARNADSRIPVFNHSLQPTMLVQFRDSSENEYIWGGYGGNFYKFFVPGIIDDNGTHINAYWKSPWMSFAPEELYERIRRLNVLFDGTLRVDVFKDFEEITPVFTGNISTTLNTVELKRVRPESRGRYHCFKLSSTLGTSFSVKSVEMKFRGPKEH